MTDQQHAYAFLIPRSLIFYSEMKQEWAREEYSLLYKEREKWAGLV
jgi:hypothetical protein